MNSTIRLRIKRRIQSFYILAFFLSSVHGLFAQKAPMKFGEPEKEELEMKVYPLDTGAVAVVLCHYGYLNGNNLMFTDLIRIKILKKEGYVYADRHKSARSQIWVSGYTFNLEDGKVVKTKLNVESMFFEKTKDGYHKVKFAMPDVKEGSVLDISVSYTGIPSEWHFQELIPVRWSELCLEGSADVSFQKNSFGSLPLFVNKEGRWVGKDMPAFKEEPFINSSENYMTKLEFDVTEIRTSSHIYNYASSWQSVCSTLMSDHNFGGALDDNFYLRNIASDIKASGKSKEEMVRAAHEAIKHIKWNKDISLYTSMDNLNLVYNRGTGNSADINLALIALLKKIGFKSIPVALSTRDNGILSPILPSLNKLNYVVAYVNTGEKSYLLDATEANLPYNLLPVRCLNHLGRYICDTTSWAYIQPTGKDKQSSYYSLELTKDFNIQGRMTTTRMEYSAYFFRNNYKSYNSKEEFLEDYVKDKPGLTLIDSKIDNVDDVNLPVKLDFGVKIDNQQNVINDEIYIQPLFFAKLTENPYKSEVRKYPLDFACKIERAVVVTLQIPENVTVESLPEPVSMKLPDGSVSFSFQAAKTDNLIQVSFKYFNNKTMVEPEDYNDIKAIIDQLVKKESEAIVLKKKP